MESFDFDFFPFFHHGNLKGMIWRWHYIKHVKLHYQHALDKVNQLKPFFCFFCYCLASNKEILPTYRGWPWFSVKLVCLVTNPSWVPSALSTHFTFNHCKGKNGIYLNWILNFNAETNPYETRKTVIHYTTPSCPIPNMLEVLCSITFNRQIDCWVKD